MPDDFKKIEVIKTGAIMTDHNFMVGTFEQERKFDSFVEGKCAFYKPLDTFKLEDLTDEQWVQINKDLVHSDWDGFEDMEPEQKYIKLIDNIILVLEKHAHKKT